MHTTADRLAAMTAADIPQPITVGELHRFAPDPAGRRRLSFTVDAAGQRLLEVEVDPTASAAAQEQVDAFASALRYLLIGSEDRVADAELRVSNLRAACERYKDEIARLERRLADFVRGPAVRGEFYAIEDAKGGVWLAGRPSSAAWGLHFRSWAELARDRPGLRPCGTCKSVDSYGPVETYVVLRPIADLEVAP